MTVAKIAITLPAEQLTRVKRAVRDGRAESVSAYITRAVIDQGREETLTDLLSELIQKHGPPTKKEREWARRVLERGRQA